MAGKVAQIRELMAGDNLARQLSGLYNNWWIQRREKELEWRELRNYLFATDTTKTTNSKLPWKNKTTLPKLTQIRDNLHANYMDALFPNDEGYDGLVIQSGIPIVSMCAHHNLAFTGYATLAYVPGEQVIGLSKLNRIVEWFSRRPQMQESLTATRSV